MARAACHCQRLQCSMCPAIRRNVEVFEARSEGWQRGAGVRGMAEERVARWSSLRWQSARQEFFVRSASP